MLLGFKRRFKLFVEDGSKTHTIRAKRKIRPRAGEGCHCYTGLRQKGAELLGRWLCTRVHDIRIEAVFQIDTQHKMLEPKQLRIWIDGEELDQAEVSALCYRDGFRTYAPDRAWYEFQEFWLKEHGRKVKKDPAFTLRFAGDLIHWNYDQPVPASATRKRMVTK